jgi:hypothetical protein
MCNYAYHTHDYFYTMQVTLKFYNIALSDVVAIFQHEQIF